MSAETAEVAGELFDDYEPEWYQYANCRGVGQYTFFGDENESIDDKALRIVQAKRICARCMVREECGDAALKRREQYGVWGGLSERDRRKILRGSKF